MTLILAALLACGTEPAPTSVPAQPDKPSQPLTPPEPVAEVAPAADLGVLGNPAALNEKAPETFKARFTTTKGDFVIEVTRSWSPNGADRFYNLVKNEYFTDIAFFRNIAGFMVQFGIHGDPQLNEIWKDAKITDDPVVKSNTPGYVSFATSGPNTRTVQMFINHGANDSLDGMGFSPFGQVVEGLSVVKELYSGYGEGAPRGRGPRQDLIQKQGNSYLKAEFPQLDYIQSAKIEE